MVRLSGGRDSKFEYPFLAYENKDRNSTIRGVPDDMEGVVYSAGPKDWNHRTETPQLLSDNRTIKYHPHHRKRILFLDNCSGNTIPTELQEACYNIETEVRYLPPNATHLTQPCDSYVI